jgi:hypothetical protein
MALRKEKFVRKRGRKGPMNKHTHTEKKRRAKAVSSSSPLLM